MDLSVAASSGGSAAERSAAAAGVNELAGDISVHSQRPLPPSAIRKRSTAAAAAAAAPSLSQSGSAYNSPSLAQLDEGHAEDDISKDDLERALEGLSRNDLVTALGRAKKAMDSLDAQLEARTNEYQELQAFTEDLIAKSNLSAADQQSIKQAVAQRDERNDHLLREQERLEEELYTQLQVVERLRRQLAETERTQSEVERRYTDQTATTDKERQAFADMEALLRSQKASESAANEKLAAENLALQRENERMANHIAALQASTGSTLSLSPDDDDQVKGDDGLTPGARRARAKSAADAEAVALRSELAAAQKAQGSYVEALTQLQTELSELKSENASLRDTNYSLIDILQEKSFSGALFAESAVLSRRFQGKGGRAAAAASMLEGTESDDDSDDSDADSAGTASHTTGTTPIEGDDVDDVPDRPLTPVDDGKAKSKRRRAAKQPKVRSRSNSNALLEVPTDLGSELAQSGGLSEADAPNGKHGKKRDRTGQEVSDDKDVLQKEVIELRETNAALTVYISKVIDRVLARDGFERVLSTDPEVKRAGIASQRSKARSRPSVLPVRGDNASGEPRASPTSAGGATLDRASNVSSSSGTSKRQSMGLLGFGRTPLASTNDGAAASQAGGSGNTASSNSHARSRMSVDWRNLLSGIGGGGGGGGASGGGGAKDPREANLRPLVLRTSTGAARKVAEHEEVEDQHDEFERERIRADLEIQGFAAPDHQLRQRTASLAGRGGGGGAPSGGGGGSSITAFLSRVVSGSSGGASNAATEGSGSGGQGTHSGGLTSPPSSTSAPSPLLGGSRGSVRDLLAETRARSAGGGAGLGLGGGGSGSRDQSEDDGFTKPGGGLGKLRFPSSGGGRSTDSGFGTRTSSMAGDESYLVRGPT
ncbi:hypothetical protein V8E36_001971 [Tilletia maclaganii]